MRTPQFWRVRGTLSTALMPLASIYDMASTLYRNAIRPARLPVPVICIGNLTAGGSGKTPVALHIGQMIKNKGVKAFYLSRGYGGRLKGPVLVNPKQHTARDVGDEPLLLARVLPTIVCRNRLLGAQFAIQKGAKAIIMDDGFQNPFISKSLSLIVMDGNMGLGNERILPAGPMREQMHLGLKRAHAVIILNRSTLIPPLPPERPVFTARTVPSETVQALRGQKLLAFCGIAYPQKFFDMLARTGALMIDKIEFPDHAQYNDNQIKKLIYRASKAEALLVTTAKDAVRISPELQKFVYVADIHIVFDQERALSNVLNYVMGMPPDPVLDENSSAPG